MRSYRILHKRSGPLAAPSQTVDKASKPRRVFRPQAKKQLNPFSPAACTSEKTLLSPEVCELSSSQAPYQLASVQKHESSFTSLLVLSISKQIALKLVRKTEGTKMQLSPRLAEAEWSAFRLTQCAHRAASPPSAKSLGLCRRLERPAARRGARFLKRRGVWNVRNRMPRRTAGRSFLRKGGAYVNKM